MSIKGYKVFNPDWTCRGFQYKVGGTYKHDGNIAICGAGFHFCQKASDCFAYYGFDSRNKVAEVEAIGYVETIGDKSVTNKIVILREIKWSELLEIVNEGSNCTGRCNTGDCNTGHWNTGDWNTGRHNTGARNTGDRNTGYWNTGGWNTGYWNTGDENTGDRNTGRCNTGHGNTGHWNSTDFSTGFFNSQSQPVYMFNKPTNMSRDDVCRLKGMEILYWNYVSSWWIYSHNMTDEEKLAHPEHEVTGGYLKTVDFKTACKMMWDKLDADDRQSVMDLPNFDADVFEEITGIKIEK